MHENHREDLFFLSEIDKKFSELGLYAHYDKFVRSLNNFGEQLL
jgi:hypothetical protein